jgi:hypothetical protein
MKRKAFAIGGALLLGVVAIFTLVSLLKAALGVAIIFFVGRGLMRLWMSGGYSPQSGHYFQQHQSYPGLGNSTQPFQPQGIRPVSSSLPQQSSIIPIW